MKKIKFYLSGGSENSDIEKSIGGDLSSFALGKDLFSEISAFQSVYGIMDYRCIYLVAEESIQNVHIAMENDSVKTHLGFLIQKEIQELVIEDPTVGSNFVLGVDGNYTSPIEWDNFENTALIIENELNSILTYGKIRCTGLSSLSEKHSFNLSFSRTNVGMKEELVQVISENGLSVKVTRSKQGGPINSVPKKIKNVAEKPDKVKFIEELTEPISIGNMQASDFLPIWIRRTLNKNVKIKKSEFIINVYANP